MPIAKRNDIPQDFLDQMKSNLSKIPSQPEETLKTVKMNVAAPAAVNSFSANSVPSVKTEEKKDKYADVMNIRLSKGRRNEIKAFCTNCGVTITQYIESSFEFLAKEVAEGNIVISKGGITKISK